ncbi:MAG TPA: DUF4178 domain-containing protein [Haliangium sp.]|nr:DUF4178 domain-containing protein [Haliangium sp.]
MITGLLLAILILVSVFGGGMILAQRRRALAGAPARPALPGGHDDGSKLLNRTVADLRPGDVLTMDGKDFLVDGVIAYDEEGHRWSAGKVSDAGDVRWLVVGLERGGSLTARLLAEVTDIEVSGMPPEVLVTPETRYTLGRRGTATAQVRGQVGIRLRGEAGTVERCRWWLYETPGADTLLVEQWGDTFRVLRGQKVNPDLIELLPGS